MILFIYCNEGLVEAYIITSINNYLENRYVQFVGPLSSGRIILHNISHLPICAN